MKKNANCSYLFRIAIGFLLTAAAAGAQGPGYLGIQVKANKTAEKCATIELLEIDGPASGSGLMVGDIIVKINGSPIVCDKLVEGAPLVPQLKAGARATFAILRDDKPLEFTVTASDLPARIVAAREEGAIWSTGDRLYARFLKTGEVFSFTRLPDGKFLVSGQFTEEEGRLLASYFEKSGTFRGFADMTTGQRVDLTLRHDPSRNANVFEYANKSRVQN